MSSVGESNHYNGMTFLGDDIYGELQGIVGTDVIDIAYDLGTLLASGLRNYANRFRDSFIEVIKNKSIEIEAKNTKLNGEEKIRTLTNDISILSNMRMGLNDSRLIDEINTGIRDKENEIRAIKDETFNRVIDLTKNRVDRIDDINQNTMLNVLRLRVQLASVIVDPISMDIDSSLDVDNSDNYSLGLSYLTDTIFNMIDDGISQSIATNITIR